MKIFNQLKCVLLLSLFIMTAGCGENVTPDPQNTVEESDLTDRDEALKLYNEEYLESSLSLSELSWSGNLSSCDEGTISQTAYDKTLQRINYFRTICGLPSVTWNSSWHPNCQKLALMFDANDDWSHNPPSSWSCYDAAAADVGDDCNVSYGTFGPESINEWMKERGSWNSKVIHRRWILFSRAKDFGYGTTPAGSALYCIANTSGALPASSPSYVAYPPEFIPQSLVYDRWSFSVTNSVSFYSGVDFDNAEISMNDASGNEVALTIIERTDNGYADQTIVWEPSGIEIAASSDVVYTVKLGNVLVNGETKDYEYEVTIFKP
jgi:hypothetical protein